LKIHSILAHLEFDDIGIIDIKSWHKDNKRLEKKVATKRNSWKDVLQLTG